MSDLLQNLALLRSGQPPEDTAWLKAMTAGRECWLDRFGEHYLENYIRHGGSKVKVLIGSEGSGKTHLLRCVAADAEHLGYMVVSLSLRELTWRLSNIVELYRAVAARVDREELVRGLCRRVASVLGYSSEEYDGSGSILPLLVEKEGFTYQQANRELRTAAMRAMRDSGLSLPFSTFAYTLVSARMGADSPNSLEACWKWLAGEKLEAAERKQSRLYDRLTRTNGRVWLYALTRLLQLSGKTGVVVLIDNVETLLERSPETGRFLYPPSASKDSRRSGPTAARPTTW